MSTAYAGGPATTVDLLPLAEVSPLRKSVWRDLVTQGHHASFFQSPDWCERVAGLDTAKGGLPLCVWLTRLDGSVFLIPLSLWRQSGLTVAHIMGDMLSQYADGLGFVPTLTELQTLTHSLQAVHKVSLIVLRRVRQDALLNGVLAQVPAIVADKMKAPYCPLDPSHPALLMNGRVPTAFREAKRDRRRLERRFETRFEVMRGGADVREAWVQALHWKRQWLASRGLPNRALFDPDASRILETIMIELPEAATGVLFIDGNVAAIQAGFVQGNRFYAFLTAYRPDLSHLSPGKVVMAETIQWAAASGLNVFDHLNPADPYKMDWTDRAIPSRDYAIALDWAGYARLRLIEMGLKPLARYILQKAPISVRKGMTSLLVRS